jgi:recombination protein RecA
MAVEAGIVAKRGSYFYLGDEMLAQGRENAKTYLRENVDTAAQIERTVREELALAGAPPPVIEDESEDAP